MILFSGMLLTMIGTGNGWSAPAAGSGSVGIYVQKGATNLERLAASEIRRYLYIRTGTVVRIGETAGDSIPGTEPAFLVARKDRPVLRTLGSGVLVTGVMSLGAEQYLLKSVRKDARPLLVVCGGDDTGVLYAAYRLAERLGVRFYLHGDVVPDGRIPLSLPEDMNETGSPLFTTRGIQPFHDFPEGPDWWNEDDYKAIVSQLPKLRMNFFGLHTYPENGPNAEPAVWIGAPGDVRPDGTVGFAYPSSWQNTLRGNWGYLPKKTGDYTRGSSMLFDRDDYGAEVMKGYMPQPNTPEGSIVVFDRAGAMFRDVFSHARSLGVKTCVGTETPLVIPKLVRERLAATGKNPADSTVVAELYTGMFTRIKNSYPLDYFWFWTPEGWTWEGNSDTQVRATLTDINAARTALARAGNPFRLATCGWVLGPVGNRALFGDMLHSDIALSCINRQVGMTPVDRAFERVTGHPRWAIPWMEDDPALTAPQLWVGRMRQDAADALRYGCDGLLGIHWRTRILGPNVSALAHAAWNQEPWGKIQASGPMDGRARTFEGSVEGASNAALYRKMRTEVTEYRFVVPNGEYEVTLRFCEPEFEKAGERVFGISLQGQDVLPRLDIFAEAGKMRALDKKFPGIVVSDEILDLRFPVFKGAACISAIEIAGKGYSKKIDCGGPALDGYDADWTAIPARYRPVADFYDDWCASEFGPTAGSGASKIFRRIDGYLPRPADWVNGPGGMKPDPRKWESAAPEYAFVDELAALRPKVKGKGAIERYEYWLGAFRYMRAMARLECVWGEFNNAAAKVKADPDSASRAGRAVRDILPIYIRMQSGVDEVYRYLLPTVSTNGEMGTVMNWEQHLFPLILIPARAELEKLAGPGRIPPENPARKYSGPPRIIVPTVRTAISDGETLKLKVIILDSAAPRRAEVRCRPLGRGTYTSAPLVHVGRGVYAAVIPAMAEDFEYSIRVVTGSGKELLYPTTAPEMNQTVVATPLVSR
jgi:hypothetical protein